jgi:hypothetical protein
MYVVCLLLFVVELLLLLLLFILEWFVVGGTKSSRSGSLNDHTLQTARQGRAATLALDTKVL